MDVLQSIKSERMYVLYVQEVLSMAEVKSVQNFRQSTGREKLLGYLYVVKRYY